MPDLPHAPVALDTAPPRETATPSLRRIRRTAWSTAITVLVPSDAATAVEAVLDATLDRVDAVASRFRADSEVSRHAAAPGSADGMVRAEISRELTDLLLAAERAAELTDGLVDPCLGGELIAAGYGRAPGLPLDGGPTGRIGVRFSDLTLDPARGRIEMPAGTLLDLGAIAKSRTADRLALTLAGLAGGGVLVDLGGDIATAGPAPDGGWIIDVAPCMRGTASSRIRLETGAIATSSTQLRAWGGPATGGYHVIDPRTGASADTLWTQVSAVAGSCADANTAATAALILGEDAPAHLAANGLAARLVARDGQVLAVGAWPTEGPTRPTDLPSFAAGIPVGASQLSHDAAPVLAGAAQ